MQLVTGPVVPGGSSRHWKPGSPSLDVNENDTSRVVPSPGGLAVIVVSGATLSTVTLRLAASPVFVAASVAVALYVCTPSGTFVSWSDHAPVPAAAATVPLVVVPSTTVTVEPRSAGPPGAAGRAFFAVALARGLNTR